jgi:hypothetical protein
MKSFSWRNIRVKTSGALPASRRALESFVISQDQCDPVAKGVEKIVFSLLLFIAKPKSFDLLNEMISRLLLVDHRLVEGVVGVFDESLMNIG